MKRKKILTLVFIFFFVIIVLILSFSCSKENNSNNNYNQNNKNSNINENVPESNITENDGKIAKNINEINWDEYDKTVNISSNNDKFFMFFFYADWCPYCKKMEETTFKNKDVIEILNNNFISLKINSESKQILSKINKNITGISLAQSYQITGLPTVVFLDKKGVALTAVPGYLPSDLFITILKYIYTESYKNESFESFQSKQK